MLFKISWVMVGLLVGMSATGSVGAGESTSLSESEKQIEQVLQEPTEMEFVEAPLNDVVAYLEDYHRKHHPSLHIQIDNQGLSESGIGKNCPMTISAKGVSLKAALRLLLEPVNMGYTVRDDVLLITSSVIAKQHLRIVIYDVSEFIQEDGGMTLDDVIKTITMIIQNVSKSSQITVEMYPIFKQGTTAIVVSAPQEIHEAIGELLAKMRALPARINTPAKNDQAATATFIPSELPLSDGIENTAEREICKKLDVPISIEFKDTPLPVAMKSLAEKANVNISLDEQTLKEAGVNDLSKLKCTGNFQNVTLAKILDAVASNDLGCWTVSHGQLLITTSDFEGTHLTTRCYNVSDFPSFRTNEGEPSPDILGLNNLILNIVRPTSWDDVGGSGSIKPFRMAGVQTLVVTNTFRVHRETSQLLNQLRKLRNKPLTKEDLKKLPPLSTPDIPAPRLSPNRVQEGDRSQQQAERERGMPQGK